MKKIFLLLFTALLLPTLLAAQEKLVQVPYTCGAGNAFTIRIPVKFPDSMTVQYAWYRNDTLIEGTQKLLMSNEKAIAYTVPTDKAFGSAVYHFAYNLHDEYDGKWSRSPRYAVSFLPVCPPAPGTVSVAVGCVSDVGTVGVAVGCVSNAGTVNVDVGGCVSNAGTVNVTVGCVSDVGTISFSQ